MVASDEGSLEGRGREELLPERGDPFLHQEDPNSKDKLDETADVLPLGLERRQEKDQAAHKSEEVIDYEMPRPGSRSRMDGGMYAVDPPLPEDVLDESVPPPVVDPELPPPPDRDVNSLLEEQESLKGAYSASVGKITELTDKASPKRDNLLVSELRWKRLHAKADLLRERMNKEIDNPHLKKLLLDQIAIACDQGLRSREEFEESERILNEVEGRIQLEQQVQRWSTSLRSWVLAYECLFAVLFIVGLFLLPNVIEDLTTGWFPEISSAPAADFNTMVISMLWGGLGGTVSAMIGLWAHRAMDQEIDRHWAIWFFANPFMGIVLGALIFLLLRAILLGIFPSTSGSLKFSWVLYVLAWIAGFEQNVLYDLIERAMKVMESRRGGSQSSRRK